MEWGVPFPGVGFDFELEPREPLVPPVLSAIWD